MLVGAGNHQSMLHVEPLLVPLLPGVAFTKSLGRILIFVDSFIALGEESTLEHLLCDLGRALHRTRLEIQNCDGVILIFRVLWLDD